MENLILIKELSINGYNSSILEIISLTAILSGIFVITTKNPIISILFLIMLFASISCYLIILGLTFIGLSYLIVYIGAVSILFLFILMLINIRISELQSNTSNNIILTIIIGISLYYVLFHILPQSSISSNFINSWKKIWQTTNIYEDSNPKFAFLNSNNYDIFYITSKTWENNLAENSHITAIGNIMYTNYSIWLLLASFILLLAMVGAIVITIKQSKS